MIEMRPMKKFSGFYLHLNEYLGDRLRRSLKQVSAAPPGENIIGSSWSDWLSPVLVLAGCLAAPSAIAQPTSPNIPNPLPSDTPELRTPTLLPPPEELLKPAPQENPNAPSPAPDSSAPIPQNIQVQQFMVNGSTIFDPADFEEILGEFTNRPLSFAELLQARSRVTELYTEKGYITSGAFIPPQELSNGTVNIQVLEGEIEDITVSFKDLEVNEATGELINVPATGHLKPSYVRNRLQVATDGALNVDRLLTGLQMLQLDPLIENLSAELSAGSRPGRSLLDVKIREASPYRSSFSIDNGRAPSVGTFRQEASIGHANLLGYGDAIDLTYTNTEGSGQWQANYSIPINARNGRLSFNYSNTDSEIIEPPFDRVDIEAKSRNYEVSLRQPLIQTPTREFNLGFTAVRRESDTSLLGVNFPLSPGANDNGETRLSILRFFQEVTARDAKQVFAARSQFSLGVGWFDATVNDDEPDSQFFGWRGQLQWLRLLAPETVLLLRSDLQLTPDALVPLEQFGLGGQQSVRGYRQDTLLTDNAIFASAEVRVPVFKNEDQDLVLQVAPFVDVGTSWNSDGPDPEDKTLASVGLGLQFQWSDRLTARVDWGYPLIDVNSRDRTWQEDGFYFSLIVNPF
jgi:hemolysin activation/secretion protein